MIIGSGNKQDKWTIRVTDLLNWLNDHKSPVLVAGENITLTQNANGTITISASSGGGGASPFVHFDTEANWNAQRSLIGREGHTYVYTDHATIAGVNIPAIKVGDGNAYLIDVPFVDGNSEELLNHVNNSNVHVTSEEKEFWNNKERTFISANNPENLVFTKQ